MGEVSAPKKGDASLFLVERKRVMKSSLISPPVVLQQNQDCALPCESRYSVTELPDGFRVEGNGRVTVEVRLEQTHWSIEGTGDSEVYRHYPYKIGLYAYRYLLEEIASVLMWHWKPPAGHTDREWPVRSWVFAQTRWALNTRVHAQWQRLLATVADPVRLVARAVFAATFDRYSMGCEGWDELFSGEYPRLIHDVITYRAAAIACHNAVTLASCVTQSISQRRTHTNPESVPCSIEAHFASLRDPSWRNWSAEEEPAEVQRREVAARRAILDALAEDWKAFFSCAGQAYRSLNRTLMAFPGGIPNTLISRFPFMELSRPVTTRLELVTQLTLHEQLEKCVYGPDTLVSQHWAARIAAKATHDEIVRALRRFCSHEHLPVRAKGAVIYQLSLSIAMYCAECPPEHNGTIVGLTEKVLGWIDGKIALKVAQIDRKALTTPPPIPLPTQSGIHFLASAAAIIEEGEHMSNCIADYTDSALTGSVYLFHIDHSTGVASTMVNASTGTVEQSYGPGRRPRTNKASAYGKHALARWAKGLPETKRHLADHLAHAGLLEVSEGEGDEHPF